MKSFAKPGPVLGSLIVLLLSFISLWAVPGRVAAAPDISEVFPQSSFQILPGQTLSAAVFAAGSNEDVAGGEYYFNTDPGEGNGTNTEVKIPTSRNNVAGFLVGSNTIGATLPAGTHTLYLRVHDATGEWSSSSSATVVVAPDTQAPTIIAMTITPNPRAINQSSSISVAASDNIAVVAGEYFLGADPGEGNATPAITGEVNGQTFVNGPIGTDLAPGSYAASIRVRDAAGNWSATVSGTLVVLADTNVPEVQNLTISPDYQKPVDATATLTATASDTSSFVTAAEYYLDTDPGQGNGIALDVANGSALSGTIGTNILPGTYTVFVRARDTVGNWSMPVSTTLVVTNTTTGVVTGTGNNAIVPDVDNSVLPGLVDPNQNDKASFTFTVASAAGVISNTSTMDFSFDTGKRCNNPDRAENCHEFLVDATQIDWLLIEGTNNATARFRGIANVTVDGVTTTNIFEVLAVDGARLGAGQSDHFTLNVYAVGANPQVDDPIYRVSEVVLRDAITIQ